MSILIYVSDLFISEFCISDYWCSFLSAVAFSLHAGIWELQVFHSSWLNFSSILFSARQFSFLFICQTCFRISLFGFWNSVSPIYISFSWVFLDLLLVDLMVGWGEVWVELVVSWLNGPLFCCYGNSSFFNMWLCGLAPSDSSIPSCLIRASFISYFHSFIARSYFQGTPLSPKVLPPSLPGIMPTCHFYPGTFPRPTLLATPLPVLLPFLSSSLLGWALPFRGEL